MRDYVTQQGIAKGQAVHKRDILVWFSEKYPKIKEGTINAHLIMLSVNAPSRIHYNVHSTGEDDLFYQVDGSHYRLYDVSSDPRPIYTDAHRPQDTAGIAAYSASPRSSLGSATRSVAENGKGDRILSDLSFAKVDVAQNIHDYVYGDKKSAGIQALERYSSFDYCFNYFQSFKQQDRLADLLNQENIEKSCLHLGFYLASWGMFRGAAFLLNKSVRVYEAVILSIIEADPMLWQIDANCYTSSNIRILLDYTNALARTLDYGNGPSDTLVTKIMLGVFGNVPAFDTYFKSGLGVTTFGKHSLEKIARFYEANRTAIDLGRRPTLDFLTGQPTDRAYTRAKVIDMIFFIEGGKQP